VGFSFGYSRAVPCAIPVVLDFLADEGGLASDSVEGIGSPFTFSSARFSLQRWKAELAGVAQSRFTDSAPH
jgi:hypothetical protein